MQYQISSDNIDLSPSMEVLTKEKFQRIESRLVEIEEGSKSARVVLNSAPDNMFEVKSLVNVKGKEYFSGETDYSLEGALIKTVEEIVQMMEKDKDVLKKKEIREEKRFEEVLED